MVSGLAIIHWHPQPTSSNGRWTPTWSAISANRLLKKSAGIRRTFLGLSGLTGRSGLSGLGLNETNQMNQRNQINQRSSSTRKKPRATDYGVFAHRNPGKYKLRNDGGSQYRSEERRARGWLFQEPPRITLYPPIDGPVGFFDGLFL